MRFSDDNLACSRGNQDVRILNELIFFSHIFLLIIAIFVALRLGKSALFALLSLQIVMSNLFVTKQMVCFGFHITCTDVYTIGSLFSLNLIQEFFGKRASREAIYTSFFLLILFSVVSQIHLQYIASPQDTMQGAFAQILGSAPRITIASFIVCFVCQRLDASLYQFFKKKFPRRSFPFHFGSASLISQLADTVLFSLFGLYALVESVFDIITLSYLIKVGVIFSMAPFTLLAKRFMRGSVQI